MAAILSVASAPPVIADTDPSPTPSGESPTEATDPPVTDPSDPPAPDPSDPPPPDPSDPPPDPSDPPTTDPSDPPTSDPSDPPTSDPSDPPTTPPPTTPPPGSEDPGQGNPTPAKPELKVGMSTSSSTMKPGGTITATLRVSANKATAHGTVVRLSASGASVSPAAQGMGSVGGGGRSAPATIKAPANAKPGKIKVTVTATASRAARVSRTYSLIITTPSGALPPGISLSSLPSDLPPLAPPPYDPMATFPAFPQVALPPVASPQIAPSPPPITSANVALRANTFRDGFGTDDLAALQAGWLAALATSSALVLTRARLGRRRPLPAYARRWLAGRPRTEARLRTIPPRPAPVPSRVFWLPLNPRGAVRL
jgi:hypothetical protein